MPRQKYLHQDLKFWVGRLLSQKGVKDVLHQCRHVQPPADPNALIPDIWFSNMFSHLQDVHNLPFFPSPVEKGRLVFSLSVDSFNPFYMKTAKQSAFSTGIWLVLLNFPPYLRYFPENMFLVGVILGPNKLTLDQINHSLALVVKDLLEFWNPGVFFSHTQNHCLGQLFQAMLVPLIADMLAVHQVLGLLGIAKTHYFCTFCDLNIDDIDVLNLVEWPKKECCPYSSFHKDVEGC